VPLAGSSVTKPYAPESGLPSISTTPLKLPSIRGGGTFASASSCSELPTTFGCGGVLGSIFCVGPATRGGAPA
jgi:hypothetical protein